MFSYRLGAFQGERKPVGGQSQSGDGNVAECLCGMQSVSYTHLAEERSKQAIAMLATGIYLNSGAKGGGLSMGAALNSVLQLSLIHI